MARVPLDQRGFCPARRVDAELRRIRTTAATSSNSGQALSRPQSQFDSYQPDMNPPQRIDVPDLRRHRVRSLLPCFARVSMHISESVHEALIVHPDNAHPRIVQVDGHPERDCENNTVDGVEP